MADGLFPPEIEPSENGTPTELTMIIESFTAEPTSSDDAAARRVAPDRSAPSDTAPASDGTSDGRYRGLAQAALAEKRQGRFVEARALYEQALAEARRLGEPDRIDRALCNHAAIVIALEDPTSVRGPLRAVLMRRTSNASAFLAADNLSWIYEQQKDFKKGLFYAQVATNHAQATEKRDWLASTYNQTGNCLVGDSRFEEAAEAYRKALELTPKEPSAKRALMMSNLGYCAAMLEDTELAFELAFRSLRWLRRFGDERGCGWAHLDLCHAYVQIGRFRRACHHGSRALELAERVGEAGLLKNVLFMFGEAQQQSGNMDAAYELFSRMQESFYPEQPQLIELLLAVDLRQMVNLRA